MSKTAIVTGAGSGIGRGGGQGAAQGGLQCRARRAPARAARGDGGGEPAALVVPTDVTKSSSVDALFEAASEKFGRVDLLFNNAGTNAVVPFDELTDEQWKGVVDVNLTGMFYCARAAVRADEGAGPAGRAHHQQRLDLRACPAPASGAPTPRRSTPSRGLTKSISLDCRAFDICCRPDRHRQCADRDGGQDADRRDAGERHDREGAADRRAARGEHSPLHGLAAARREHPVPDGHGQPDAVRAGEGKRLSTPRFRSPQSRCRIQRARHIAGAALRSA